MYLFRKKPITIQAMQFDGTLESFQRIWEWACPSNDTLQSPVHCDIDTEEIQELYVKTLEGRMTARAGDWIIRGVAGEFYPCKPEIFVKTYEPADDQAAAYHTGG